MWPTSLRESHTVPDMDYFIIHSVIFSNWSYYIEDKITPKFTASILIESFDHFICPGLSIYSHEKWNDSLEGGLDRVLFTAELELEILVPRLSKCTSNVNIECAGKSEWSKQL